MTDSENTTTLPKATPKPRRRKPVDIIRRAHLTTKGVRHPDFELIRLGKKFMKAWQGGADLTAQINAARLKLVEDNPPPELLRKGAFEYLSKPRLPHDHLMLELIVSIGHVHANFEREDGIDKYSRKVTQQAVEAYFPLLEAAEKQSAVPALNEAYEALRRYEKSLLAKIAGTEPKTPLGVAIKLRALDHHYAWTHKGEWRHQEPAPNAALVAALVDAERLAMECAGTVLGAG